MNGERVIFGLRDPGVRHFRLLQLAESLGPLLLLLQTLRPKYHQAALNKVDDERGHLARWKIDTRWSDCIACQSGRVSSQLCLVANDDFLKASGEIDFLLQLQTILLINSQNLLPQIQLVKVLKEKLLLLLLYLLDALG